jgi:predicted DNA-binding transcriptional regulator AlpA
LKLLLWILATNELRTEVSMSSPLLLTQATPVGSLHPDTRLLRLNEVRAKLKVGKTTLHEFWKEGSRYYKIGFPSRFYIGRTPYVLECELDAYILAQKGSSPLAA